MQERFVTIVFCFALLLTCPCLAKRRPPIVEHMEMSEEKPVQGEPVKAGPKGAPQEMSDEEIENPENLMGEGATLVSQSPTGQKVRFFLRGRASDQPLSHDVATKSSQDMALGGHHIQMSPQEGSGRKIFLHQQGPQKGGAKKKDPRMGGAMIDIGFDAASEGEAVEDEEEDDENENKIEDMHIHP